MQKHLNLVDLVKSSPTNTFLQNLASIQKRTSPIKFDHLAENQSKVRYRIFQLRRSFPGGVRRDEDRASEVEVRDDAQLRSLLEPARAQRMPRERRLVGCEAPHVP